MLAVVISKNDGAFDGSSDYIYTIRRADGKTLSLRNGIYPIGHFKDEV
jgi:hypothetical protein